MTPTRSILGLVPAAVLTLSLLAACTAPAGALATATASAGYCGSGAGATVVVDASALDRAPIARCARDAADMTGVEALRTAGFTVTGVARWGDTFVCRIDGRPAPAATLDVPGQSGYRERCVDTPPATAYWSYWTADSTSCRWRFATEGAAQRRLTAGDVDGWAFSLGGSRDTAAAPRLAPCAPAARSAPDARATAAPATSTAGATSPADRARTSAPTGRRPGATHVRAASDSRPAPLPRPRAHDERADPAAATAAHATPDPAASATGAGRSWTTWAAALMVLALGASALLRRRRGRRDSPDGLD